MSKKKTEEEEMFMWRFCAYKSNKDYERGDHYFMKDFSDHTEMKIFSSAHSAKEKTLYYTDYCSVYWKLKKNIDEVKRLE